MACDLRLKTLLPSYLDLPGVYTHFIFLKESLMKFQCGDKHGHFFSLVLLHITFPQTFYI